jgi:hypothetical protein
MIFSRMGHCLKDRTRVIGSLRPRTSAGGADERVLRASGSASAMTAPTDGAMV